MPVPRDIEAIVEFLPESQGGRSSPAKSGYRPQFFYAGKDWDAPHEYPDVPEVAPGERARAFIGFLSPAEHDGNITVGMPFLIREGSRIVGYGSVTELLELAASAQRQGGSS